MSKISCNFYSQEDIYNLHGLDFNVINKITEEALVNFNKGDILFPEKIVQIFNEETQDRINVLPATLVHEKISGVKWVSVFPLNPTLYQTQNLSAVIILSELVKGYPVAFMDATLISNMRTASVSAVAAKHLSREDSKVLGFIGSGEQAKMHLHALINVRPSIEEVRISSKSFEETGVFIKQMSKYFDNIKFVDCGHNLEDAIRGSDIIVTATSAQSPLLKADWIKNDAFYLHVGGWEDEYDVVRKASKIVNDDWGMIKGRTQTVSRMYKEDLLKDDDIYNDLHEIVANKAKGRTLEDGFIYFTSVGLSYVDISLANYYHNKLLAANKGKKLVLQNKKIFE